MPSLRELLALSILSGDTYDLLEALVEAVEPDETPTVEEYNDVRDTTIRKLRKELAQAKAEIERLEKNRDYLRRQTIRARDTRVELCRQLTEARVELESYTASGNADAEIGQLVWNMRRGTRLVRGTVGLYWGSKYTGGSFEAAESWVCAHGDGCAVDDPAEALRSIQEVGDAGG